jgi:hypothetical protein
LTRSSVFPACGAAFRSECPSRPITACDFLSSDYAAAAHHAWHRRQSDSLSRQPVLLRDAGSKDKTLKLYEGHYHDLLNDIGKEGVMADIKAWIGSHSQPLPGARQQTAPA